MEISLILPVIALIIGWLLNEFSRYFGFRQERHGAIGHTLSQLLIVTTSLTTVKLLTDFMTRDLRMPISTIPKVKRLFTELMPYSGDDVDQQVRDSVAVISSFDPTLAYQLSINMSASEVFPKLLFKVEGNEESDELFIDFISKLENKMLPLLAEVTLSLAKKHGLLTYFRVKRLMKEQLLPEDIKTRLTEFKEKLEEL